MQNSNQGFIKRCNAAATYQADQVSCRTMRARERELARAREGPREPMSAREKEPVIAREKEPVRAREIQRGRGSSIG